jgi:hypothetical protein
MNEKTRVLVKQPKRWIVALMCGVASMVGCSDGSNDSQAATDIESSASMAQPNVIVSTLNTDGEPLETSYASWCYINDEGYCSNPVELECLASNFDTATGDDLEIPEKCSTRYIFDFNVDGAIKLHASIVTRIEPDGCQYGIEGDATTDADPSMPEQSVYITVDKEWGVCP